MGQLSTLKASGKSSLELTAVSQVTAANFLTERKLPLLADNPYQVLLHSIELQGRTC
jgi:hypothetical protein